MLELSLLLALVAAPLPATEADFGTPTALVETAPSKDAVLTNLQQRYQSVQDFQASFTQVAFNVARGEPRVSNGQVYFMRPGRMLWDYTGERRLLLDGEQLHSIDLVQRQYYSAPVGSSEIPAALRFLMGEGRLDEDFHVGEPELMYDGNISIELRPRVPTPDYTRLLFVINTGSWDVLETTLVDALGNTNTITFSEIRTNVGMSASSFVFTPPAGMTRVEVPE